MLCSFWIHSSSNVHLFVLYIQNLQVFVDAEHPGVTKSLYRFGLAAEVLGFVLDVSLTYVRAESC